MAQLSVVCTTAGIVATDLTGADGITVTTTTGIITISGFRSEFVSASGFLQGQISAGGVSDLNTLTGSVIIAGAGEVSVSTAGQTITVSGSPHTGSGGGGGTVSNALVGADGITVTSGSSTDTISGFQAEFVAASGALQSDIDAIDSSVTLQDAFDNSLDGYITTTSGKYVVISGTESTPYSTAIWNDAYGPSLALEVASGILMVHSGSLEHPGLQIEQPPAAYNTAGITSRHDGGLGLSLVVGGERFMSLQFFVGPVKEINFEDSDLFGIGSLTVDRLGLSSNGTALSPAIYWTTTAAQRTGFIKTVWWPGQDAIATIIEGDYATIVSTGTMQILGGTEDTPALTMFSPQYDTQSGLYQIGMSHIGFSTAGTLALEMDSSQVVNAPVGLTVSGIPVATGTSSASAGVNSVNSLSGDITLQGAGLATVTETGQTITISGTSAHLLATAVVDVPSDDEDLTIIKLTEQVTLQNMFAVIRGPGSPSVTWTIRHWDNRDEPGVEVVTAGTTTTSKTTGDNVTALDNPTISANEWVWLETTVTGGSPQELTVELYVV